MDCASVCVVGPVRFINDIMALASVHLKDMLNNTHNLNFQITTSPVI